LKLAKENLASIRDLFWFLTSKPRHNKAIIFRKFFPDFLTNPAAATFDAGAGAKPIYASGGTRVPDTGEIPANTILQLRYNASLNGALGGWQILNTLRDRATVFEMVGASAVQGGLGGLVPAPRAGDEDKLLAGDGTYHDLDEDITAAIQATGALNPLPLFLAVNY